MRRGLQNPYLARRGSSSAGGGAVALTERLPHCITPTAMLTDKRGLSTMPMISGEFRISSALAVLVSVLSVGCVERAGSGHVRTQVNSDRAKRGAVCTSIHAAGNAPLVDDFESQTPRILGNEGRGGWWFSYDDNTGGKLKRETVSVDTDTGKNRVLHVASTGFAKWGAGFGFNLHPESTLSRVCAYDASTYDGIRFRAKGHGRVRVVLGEPSNIPPALGGACSRAANLCHDRPGVWVDLGSEWKSFELPFCSFLPEGWGVRLRPPIRRSSSVSNSTRVRART